MSEKNRVQVLQKAIAVLEDLSDRREPVGLTEVAKATELSKTTAYRILSTFVESNILMKDIHGRYQIGPAVVKWAATYNRRSGLLEMSRDVLEIMRDYSGETIHLFVFENGRAYYLEKLESPSPLVMRSKVGAELPLYSTAGGKAILSALPLERIESYLKKTVLIERTTNTITDPEELIQQLKIYKTRGYSEENQENEEGIRCVAVPIVDSNGFPLGAVSVSAPAYRFDDKKAVVLGRKLAQETAKISLRINRRHLETIKEGF
ncbi:MAG: IclR family transcriptional regulator [Aminobacterium sp.]|jgi:DNA-binding IclR family transcriptional regulator|uniref:IclR family transcriptional regulator n=1 Tax=unclassified Aminobacterium TaxID=2685012 RepID=UPI001BCDFC77|nr:MULTISPECIES: IclR family transcriptional regulator [unclassified Aminobacterium]MDD2207584.1 IclR family transcriptional regulator [Aminobacterium sp.]MDD3427053.1 IclR family transcriptional regulator [Aminobacterium sp.]MDD3708220.1 IclR family transcriptional regulator [Aminobacterium sp.]MDD4229556.1 IclR family transcriptional regulator [Aminobacterium sp.]MDD4552409.1 IclR family transcriptional regulator [Aminobacterium sp.]